MATSAAYFQIKMVFFKQSNLLIEKYFHKQLHYFKRH